MSLILILLVLTMNLAILSKIRDELKTHNETMKNLLEMARRGRR